MSSAIAKSPSAVLVKSTAASSKKCALACPGSIPQARGARQYARLSFSQGVGNGLALKQNATLRAAPRATVAVTMESSVEKLNTKFGVDGSVKVVEGEGGLPKVVLTHENGGSAELYLFGACVTSWVQPHGSEVLYVRPDAKFDGVKPISGGIPHCFPQFGPGEMQQHGFARNLNWDLIATSAAGGEPSVTVQLKDQEYTREMWDYGFEAQYEVKLCSDKLNCELKVKNTGTEEFDFDTALHSYIGVDPDQIAAQVSVKGLKGKTYMDKVVDANDPPLVTEEREAVSFGSALVDNVYLNTDPKALLDVGTGCGVQVENTKGFTDTVVWNPHLTMEACWKEFVCVESAKVSEKVTLGEGREWVGEMNMSVIDF